jgi:hypothetical protein
MKYNDNDDNRCLLTLVDILLVFLYCTVSFKFCLFMSAKGITLFEESFGPKAMMDMLRYHVIWFKHLYNLSRKQKNFAYQSNSNE